MEELISNNEKSPERRSFSRESNGKTSQYSVELNPTRERIQLLNSDGKEIGYLVFSADSKDAGKLRVQDMRINSEVHGNNLAIELYEELLAYVTKNNLSGIKSDDVVYFGAAAVWKKLADKGYHLAVNENAQAEYDAFCVKYNAGEEYINEDSRLSAKRGASVFEILL